MDSNSNADVQRQVIVDKAPFHTSRKEINFRALGESLIRLDRGLTHPQDLGFVWSNGADLCVFAESLSYLEQAASADNVVAILVPADQKEDPDFNAIVNRYASKTFCWCKSPKVDFYRLQNSIAGDLSFSANQIHPSVVVGPNCSIAPHGVRIDSGTVVEPNATIFPGVAIGKDCIIRSGARIGSETLDVRILEDGTLQTTIHAGGVEIADGVEIGNNCVVDRAIFRHLSTRIGEFTKIACLTNISHGVEIGSRNIIAGGVLICGSTRIGDDNWIGPGSTVSNLLTLGSRNFISLGSVVLKDLGSDQKQVGNKVFRDRKLF